jgi:FkbM family methyltransferase
MGTMVSATNDEVIGRSLATTGDFQTAELSRTCDFLTSETDFLRSRELFVDVGANLGTHTLHALTNLGFERATSLEPQLLNFRLLTANVALNGMTDRVQCLRAGCAATEQTAHLRLSPTNSGDHRIVGSSTQDLHGESTWTTEEVALLRLDRVVRRVDRRATLVWIDTQGHEADVLAGMPKLIARGVPIAFEFWPYGWREAGRTLEDLHRVLTKHELRDIGTPELAPITMDELADLFHAWTAAESPAKSEHTMVLAVPQ